MAARWEQRELTVKWMAQIRQNGVVFPHILGILSYKDKWDRAVVSQQSCSTPSQSSAESLSGQWPKPANKRKANNWFNKTLMKYLHEGPIHIKTMEYVIKIHTLIGLDRFDRRISLLSHTVTYLSQHEVEEWERFYISLHYSIRINDI